METTPQKIPDKTLHPTPHGMLTLRPMGTKTRKDENMIFEILVRASVARAYLGTVLVLWSSAAAESSARVNDLVVRIKTDRGPVWNERSLNTRHFRALNR